MSRVGASLSTQFANYYADNMKDGDYNSICGTGAAQNSDQWASVRVSAPSGTTIGYVVVYNRPQAWAHSWLLPFEVWAGDGFGSTLYSCGGAGVGAAPAGPFTVWCGDAPAGLEYVTVLLRAGTQRWLTISELEVYGTSLAPPAAPTSPSPRTSCWGAATHTPTRSRTGC